MDFDLDKALYGKRHKRLPGYEWEAVRQRIYRRDKGICQVCGKKISLEETDVDHIIALCLGGDNSDDNFRSLCEDCHKKKTKQDADRVRSVRRIKLMRGI